MRDNRYALTSLSLCALLALNCGSDPDAARPPAQAMPIAGSGGSSSAGSASSFAGSAGAALAAAGALAAGGSGAAGLGGGGQSSGGSAAGAPSSAGASTEAGGQSGSGGAPQATAGSAGRLGTGGGGTLSATPPMGWNNWNSFARDIRDTDVEAIADAMVSSGMKDAGYQYVTIDDVWADHRDASGKIVPNSKFPDIKGLADYIHSKGLKFGIYSDRGTKTCGGFPGSLGYETKDASSYAAWGVDFLKYDNCFANSNSMQVDYTTMGNALKATGRTIVYSICAWQFQPWMPKVGQMWRTTLDIKGNWGSVTSMMDQNAEHASAAGPGHWNDPDMLEVGYGSLTDTQSRAHFSMWAMMAAPLMAGNDVRNMSAATRAILTAPEVIAVDQDALGVQGTRIKGKGSLEVWKKTLSGTNTLAVAFLNRTNSAADITVSWAELGLPAGAARVRDLWARSELGSVSDTYTAKAVPATGITLLKIAAP